ncbi:uncharacterized protein LOC119163281 [Rhipicephalus microplus]|uniref:uncharacterized protein LOC119163281 n=1 Tax=Rhipicephalus microplus TaxID=6941 RepID=UPI003F6BC8A5
MNLCINIIAVFLTGATWAKKLADPNNLLQDLFGNLIPNYYSLRDAYFTVRPPSQPSSPWYRFNLTDGVLVDIGDKLKPKNDKETCIVECSRGVLNARCHFNIKDASLTYTGKMSYKQPVVANFKLYAWIIEFQFYDHRNPALLSSTIVKTLSGQPRKRMSHHTRSIHDPTRSIHVKNVPPKSDRSPSPQGRRTRSPFRPHSQVAASLRKTRRHRPRRGHYNYDPALKISTDTAYKLKSTLSMMYENVSLRILY